jgi:hypothetical protein
VKRLATVAAIASAVLLGGGVMVASADTGAPEDGNGAWVYPGPNYSGTGYFLWSDSDGLGSEYSVGFAGESVINNTSGTMCGYDSSAGFDGINYKFQPYSSYASIGSPFSSSSPLTYVGWLSAAGNGGNCVGAA